MRVDDVMTRDVLTVRPEATLKDVARLLTAHGISGVPVVDADGNLLGVVSEEEVLFKERGPAEPHGGLLGRLVDGDARGRPKVQARTAADAMSTPPLTIEPWRRVAAAAAQMIGGHVRRLPVVSAGKVVGIVTRSDLVKAFIRTDEEIEGEIQAEIVRMMLPPSSRIAVTISDGDVTLAGEVEKESDAEAIAHVIERVPGVVSVESRLTGPLAGQAA